MDGLKITAKTTRTALVSEVQRLQEFLERAERAHHDDIQAIGDRLIEEAELRSWCNEYDQVVEDLNGSLTIPLPARERDVSVCGTAVVTIEIRVPFYDTIEDVTHLPTDLERHAERVGRDDIDTAIRNQYGFSPVGNALAQGVQSWRIEDLREDT